MEEKVTFQSEVRYDLETYKECNKIYTWNYSRTNISGLIAVLCMVFLFPRLETTYTAIFGLVFCLSYLGTWAFQWYRNRDGGLPYKRMLRDNNNQVPHYRITIDADAVTIHNFDREKETPCSFADMRYILETKRLLILVDNLKTAYTIDKTTLTGGSRDELIRFLYAHCPNMKKPVRKGRFGCVIQCLTRILPILMLLASLAVLFHIPEMLRGQITGNVSYEEIAEELRPLGIEISPEAIGELNQYAQENRLDFLSDSRTQILNLLCWEGQGRYEKNVFHETFFAQAYDWTWTPSTSGVYWFDLEVMNISAIYSDFLQGVSAMDDSLTFTNVEEDYSNTDIFKGSGEIGLSFDYLGEHYTFSAQYNGDWFDTDMLYHLGRILAADEDPKDLWMTLDGQGVLLYYGTEESKDLLVKKTGIDFFDCVTMRMGH